MKKILFTAAVLLILISLQSCSDDFLLKNNKDLYTLTDTIYINNNQDKTQILLYLPEAISSDFTVLMQPKWIIFDEMHGTSKGGTAPLSFSVDKDYFNSVYQIYYGTVMLEVENLGIVSFNIAYPNFGSPTLHCSTSSLNFESSDNLVFTISNTSAGILMWNINSIPGFLSVYPRSGTLTNGSSATITASLDYAGITGTGELNGSLLIISNTALDSLNIPVHVAEKVLIPSELREINGIVADAEFNRETGILAICTKTPNSLIIFNTINNESQIIPLTKTPNCVSISEDGHKAAIGYTVSSVGYADIDNLNIIGDFTVDCVPFDIILTDNGWCYITPDKDQWECLRNLNMNTGVLTNGKNFSTLYEKTIIKKIPGKPYLVGTRTNVSPNGILIFDIRKGIASDTISYYHTSTGKIWISEDGSRLYTGSRIVYNLPPYDLLFHSDNPPQFGQIESSLYDFSSFDECQAISSIFISSTYYDYTTGHPAVVEQFNSGNLNKIREIKLSPVILTENNIRKAYESSARFLFVNKEGTTLYALKNLRSSYSKTFWTLEIIVI